jgi:NADPH:quinone reductase-like Zn-dependent oxidoreductase
MKAIRIHERGGLKQLIYEDAPKPVPRRGDALVEVLRSRYNAYGAFLAVGIYDSRWM